MHLWTEYEGRTIAEHYTLGKLLRSEGRNGFFATADKDGHPAVIRLTEAHYDEAEQLRRWRHVAEVHQDNLIEIEQVGQTTFEGVALTYALMEPDDANLGDVLQERPMTTAETMQVAKAVVSALKALHESGLIHEHVEPVNVLAVGETVKLRSDCVRECVADGEFNTPEACAELRRRDLHDFGTLLLRCLTLETEWSPAHNNLPDPFKRVIPRALDGSWSLDQLGAALDPALFAPKAVPRPEYTPQAGTVAPVSPVSAIAPALNGAVPPPAPASQSVAPDAPKRPLVPPGVRRVSGSEAVDATASAPGSRRSGDPTEPTVPLRTRYSPEPVEAAAGPSRAVWAAVAVAALLVMLLCWHFFSGSKSASQSTTSRPAPVVSSGATSPPQSSSSAETAVAPAQAAVPGPADSTEPAHAAGAPGWYVIAFTYNHEAQAATKVQRLRRNHNSMHPEVFTPTGHAPFLVSLGGAMSSQDEAEAVYRHARRSGLPRDTFVRHY